MNKNVIALGLLASLLLLAACAPAATEAPVDEVRQLERSDVDVLVYASPL
jgi:hypothetical protein